MNAAATRALSEASACQDLVEKPASDKVERLVEMFLDLHAAKSIETDACEVMSRRLREVCMHA